MSFLIGQSVNSLWVIPIITNLFMFFDSLIYMFAEYSYKLFELASAINFSDFKHGTVVLQALMQRVMAFVTVFMLFRVAISIIQYLVNPEKFTDAQMGGTKIITNVFVVLALLGLVYSGFLFGLIGDFQTLVFSSGYKSSNTFEVLPDDIFPANKNKNIIASLISGADTMDVNYGRALSVSMLSSFLYLEEPDGTIDPWTEYGRVNNGVVDCGGLTYNKSVLCKIARTEEGSFLELTLLDTFWNSGDLWYYPIISGIAGFYIVFTFFKLTSQVLIRALKLFLLELISPIAIVALIDPNNGKTLFKKFWSTYVKIFLDLFLRVAFIYLAVVIIDIATKTILVPGATGGVFNESVGWFTILLLKAFLIFAVLKFIKTAPELISEVFGVKLDDKKGGFGKMLRGMVGTGIGMGVGLSSARRAGLGGAASAFQGIRGGIQGGQAGAGSTGLRDFVSRQGQANAGIRGRANNIRQLGGLGNYAGSYVDQFTGRTNRLQYSVDSANRRDANLDAFSNSFNSQFANSDDGTGTDTRYGTQQEYVDRNSDVLNARLQEQTMEEQYKSGNTAITVYDVENARNDRILAENNAKANYSNALNHELQQALSDNTRFDAPTRAAYQKLRREDPEDAYKVEVTTSTTPTGGTVYKNNMQGLKSNNANARANSQSQMRVRPGSSSNSGH